MTEHPPITRRLDYRGRDRMRGHAMQAVGVTDHQGAAIAAKPALASYLSDGTLGRDQRKSRTGQRLPPNFCAWFS